jgi:hypothetical protein
MTNYQLKPFTTFTSLASQDAKEQRRKVLEAARKIRQQKSKHRQEHEREAYKTNEDYKEYVDYSG